MSGLAYTISYVCCEGSRHMAAILAPGCCTVMQLANQCNEISWAAERVHYLSLSASTPLQTVSHALIRSMKVIQMNNISLCISPVFLQSKVITSSDLASSTPPSSRRRPGGRPPLRWAGHDRPSWRSLVRDATYVYCDATT